MRWSDEEIARFKKWDRAHNPDRYLPGKWYETSKRLDSAPRTVPYPSPVRIWLANTDRFTARQWAVLLPKARKKVPPHQRPEGLESLDA